MAGCPDGSHIKPEVLEDQFWMTVGDALEQLEGVLGPIKVQFLAQIMQQVAPSLVDLNDLCASDPPEPPDIQLDDLILTGQWAAVPHWLAQWFWATYAANRWSTFCDCNPSSGPGACPPIAKFLDTTSANYAAGYVFSRRVPCPHGWTDGLLKLYRDADGQPGAARVAWVLEDAAQASLTGAVGTYNSAVGVSDSASIGTLETFSATVRSNVRYLSIWVRATGVTPQNTTTYYPFIVGADCTFIGTCQDLVVQPPPPTPLPPPADPTLPLPPIGPTSCTVDTLCSMLYQVQLELHDLVVRFNAAQRYGLPFAYVPGEQHPSLSGGGSFAIGGLVGLRVDITSALPARQLEGTPVYIWDLGWMSIMTPEGMIDEKRITRDTQIWQPRMIQEAATFGYFLKDGVVATVTELYPEPF